MASSSINEWWAAQYYTQSNGGKFWTGITASNNIYYNGDSSSFDGLSFSQWQAKYGADQSWIIGNPDLAARGTSPSSKSYGDNIDGLQPGSPAINAGANLENVGVGALDYDKGGLQRPTTGLWNLGAFQFVSGGTTTTSVPTTSTTSIPTTSTTSTPTTTSTVTTVSTTSTILTSTTTSTVLTTTSTSTTTTTIAQEENVAINVAPGSADAAEYAYIYYTMPGSNGTQYISTTPTSPTNSINVPQGTVIDSLLVLSNPGYLGLPWNFAGWTGSYVGSQPSATPGTVVTSPYSVSANFQQSISNTTTTSTSTSSSTTSSSTSTTTVQQGRTFAYVPISIVNSQSSPTPSPFQVMIKVNSAAYENYENGNLSNVEFLYPNGGAIQSWIQSGNSNTSTNTIYWLKLPNGIPANSNMIVDMGFATQGNSLFGNGNVGEAPQLSPVYAKYDNGANIFNFYDNFAGTSLNLNKWEPMASMGSVTADNKLLAFGPRAEGYAYALTKGSFAYPSVAEALETTNTGTLNILFAVSLSNSTQTGSLQGVSVSSNTLANGTYQFSIGLAGSVVREVSLPVTSSRTAQYQWARVRAYPPYGVMPSALFLPLQTTTVTPTTVTTVQTTTVATTSIPIGVKTNKSIIEQITQFLAKLGRSI